MIKDTHRGWLKWIWETSQEALQSKRNDGNLNKKRTISIVKKRYLKFVRALYKILPYTGESR